MHKEFFLQKSVGAQIWWRHKLGFLSLELQTYWYIWTTFYHLAVKCITNYQRLFGPYIRPTDTTYAHTQCLTLGSNMHNKSLSAV